MPQPVPPGIKDPSNLYNDAYGNYPPLPYDVYLLDKIGWISEQQPSRVTEWFAITNSSPQSSFLGPTMAHMEVIVGEEFTAACDVDSLNLHLNPDLVVHMLRRAANPAYVADQIAPYPGYEARNPAGSDPIGSPLPKQPWPGRTLYGDDAPSEYAVGATFQDPQGNRYTKVSYVSVPGKGPFGTGGQTATAWEQTYKV